MSVRWVVDRLESGGRARRCARRTLPDRSAPSGRVSTSTASGHPESQATSAGVGWHAAAVTDAQTVIPIRTDRLVIRPWRHADAQRLFEMLSREDIVRWLGTPRLMEKVEEAQEKIAKMAGDLDLPQGEWAMEVAETGAVAGAIMLVPIPKSDGLVQVGWYAHPDSVGNGYVTEAARAALVFGLAQGLTEIRALTHTNNYPSIAVCRRLGMTDLGETEDWYDEPSCHFIVRAGEWPATEGR